MPPTTREDALASSLVGTDLRSVGPELADGLAAVHSAKRQGRGQTKAPKAPKVPPTRRAHCDTARFKKSRKDAPTPVRPTHAPASKSAARPALLSSICRLPLVDVANGKPTASRNHSSPGPRGSSTRT